MNRALDLGPDGGLAIEVAAEEDCLEQRLEFVIVVAQHRSQLRIQFGGEIFTHEKTIHLSRNKLCTDFLVEENLDDVATVEISRLAKNRLLARIVQFGLDSKLTAEVRPPGKGPGGLLDIVFRIVSDTQGKELHHFAGEVFVCATFDIFSVVEIHEHRRVLGDAQKQIPEIPHRVLAKHIELVQH